jgi:hypothetical protein
MIQKIIMLHKLSIFNFKDILLKFEIQIQYYVNFNLQCIKQ